VRAAIGDVEPPARHVHGQSPGADQTGRGGLARRGRRRSRRRWRGLSRQPRRGRGRPRAADDRGDDPRPSVDATHDAVAVIRDVDVAEAIHGHSHRGGQRGKGGGAVVPIRQVLRVGAGSELSPRGDGQLPRRVDLEDAAQVRSRHVGDATRIDGDRARPSDARGQGGERSRGGVARGSAEDEAGQRRGERADRHRGHAQAGRLAGP
jgi:hypothetical protein